MSADDEVYEIEGRTIRQTPKAVKFQTVQGVTLWIPKSVVTEFDPPSLLVKMWWMAKSGAAEKVEGVRHSGQPFVAQGEAEISDLAARLSSRAGARRKRAWNSRTAWGSRKAIAH